MLAQFSQTAVNAIMNIFAMTGWQMRLRYFVGNLLSNRIPEYRLCSFPSALTRCHHGLKVYKGLKVLYDPICSE